MTLIEFIKSKHSLDNPIGDLARDVFRDEKFPSEKSDSEIIRYLEFKTNLGGTNEIFRQLLKEYEKYLLNAAYKEKPKDILEAKFSILYSELWQYYKENFLFDKVYLIGEPTDIYKVYCVDTKSKTALYFNLKSDNSLNDIRLMDENKIYVGDATEQYSVDAALTILESCPYETPVKPNKKKFPELLDFVKRNKT